MRTIKRKRLFKRKSLNKSIKRKRLNKQKGGAPQNLLEEPLGTLNGNNIADLKDDDRDIVQISTSNFFSANINVDGNQRVTLSDFKEKMSRSVGWVYGSLFGNFNIIIQDGSREVALTKSLYGSKNSEVETCLFINPITKFTFPIKYLPWENQVYDINQSDIVDGDVDKTFENILKKYYLSNLKNKNLQKIDFIANSLDKGINPADSKLISYEDIHEDYKRQLKARNLLNDTEKIQEIIISKTFSTLSADDFSKLSAFRLKQEIFFKNFTEIFSSHNDVIIPFNIEYFLYEGDNFSASFLKKYIEIAKTRSSNMGYVSAQISRSLSRMIYNFQRVNNAGAGSIYSKIGDIYMNNAKNIKTKGKSNDDKDFEDYIADKSFSPLQKTTKYTDFEYEYDINSLISPKKLCELLLANIFITKIILLEQNGGALKNYKSQKVSDFLDPIGRGIKGNNNKHFDILTLFTDNKQGNPLVKGMGYDKNIEETDTNKWKADLLKDLTDLNKKKLIQVTSGDKPGNIYPYHVEENDNYLCIYVLNEKLFDILKNQQGRINLFGDEIYNRIVANPISDEILEEYFKGLLGKYDKEKRQMRTNSHSSTLYTLTPRPP